ncbi:A disintegrin and metalloproteinase with thrombospondin motifs like [Xylocopa sonorina]|uniref:A disintegrin and metalloproteinase with thrombospondin motifs like n=1 Tax=Xylocopa sonorina TaxID=1818115 RepID=UPI00403AAEE6
MHDENLGAAILVKQRNHKLHIFDGILPSNFVIRSLPERIIKDILYGENGLFKGHFTEKIPIDDLIYTYHHIIYKKIPKKSHKNFNIINPLTRMYKIPDIVYPEVLIVVDYNLYEMLGKNVDQAMQYVVAFWNGVDLRYRVLTNPKIRLNIAGIVVAMDKNAVPYIEDSLVDPTLVDADQILHGMGNYFYKENRFPWKIYDFVMSNTKLNLCIKIDEQLCDPATLGYAYVAGACNRNRTTKFSEAVGVAEDDGGFSGVLPTAHELGHLLGAHHDGTSKDAANCSADNNNIMSDTLVFSVNEFQWSNCSANSFHKFLSEDRAKCLYNEPPKATAIRRILPGKLMSLDDQCRKSYGGEACNKNSSAICYELDCVVPGTNGLCVPIAAAADGSFCGNGLICLDGACVLEGAEVMTEKMSI